MKKSGVFAVLFLLFFLLVSLSIATDDDTTTDKIEEGFVCLENKAGDCSSLTTQEIVLTILATPDNIFDDCVNELKSRQSSDNWGNIRDTALAILALKHAGQNTTSAEEWILEREQIPTELIWYMQQDSNSEVECHIGYQANDYTIIVGTDKKIDSSAGSCLTLAQSDFWLQISPDCYEEEFSIECNKDFIANLLYKNKQSSTIYVLEGTESSPAYDSIKLDVRSKCFGTNSCDYEATAWATLALLKTGHNVEEFIPYVIAMADTNKHYLPEAFIYALTSYDDYATQLIANQKLGNYWEAESSAYNRFYDTSLALVTVGSSSSEQIAKARGWLLFSQDSNGCWQNSVRETAAVLWALSGRPGRLPTSTTATNTTVTNITATNTTVTNITATNTTVTNITATNTTVTNITVNSVTYCSDAGYFCIPSFDCPSSEDVGDNYFCASLSDTCCMTENIMTCSEYGGEECASSKICIGHERKASDTFKCCTGTCEDRPQETECESMSYVCMDSCMDYQESMSSYSCDGTQVCCRTKVTTTDESSLWWIWVLAVLILSVLGAIGYVYRDKLKLLWFQIKTKFKKDDGRGGMFPRGPRPGMPPRPGFPPLRRPQAPTNRMPPKPTHRDNAMSETFQKLKELSS